MPDRVMSGKMRPVLAVSQIRRRALFAGCALALVAALAPSGASAAQPPTVTITSPENNAFTRNQEPEISGTMSDEFDPGNFTPVELKIYKGAVVPVAGEPVRQLKATPELDNTSWTVTVNPALAPGIYTAQAEQSELGGGKPGLSKPVTFTVKTLAPEVGVRYPANGSSSTGESQLVGGSAGTASGDVPWVTVELFAGGSVGQVPLLTREVPVSGASWSFQLGGLQPGAYTVQASQADLAGNLGHSVPVTFSLAAPPVRPPTASFRWFPSVPVIGQNVTLVSDSIDSVSPLTGFAWELQGNGAFAPAGPVLTTSFATVGNHLVRLRVADALGASSIAAATISVSPAALKLMQPFPIVRLGGVETSEGVKVSSLAVQAPAGVRVIVSCRGHGCQIRQQGALARATSHNRRGNSVLLAFPHFQRAFRAGVTLEVRVMAEGEIGKYTRFVVRRHAVPSRTDACVAALDPRPIACPA